MGRTGIGYAEVADAALALQAEGKIATVDAIRNRLGTGSKTTINQHLKQWKSDQEQIEGLQLPKELHTVVAGLWERLQTECALKIEAIVQDHKNECENLQSTLAEAQQSQFAAEQHSQTLETHLNNAATQNEHLQREARQLKQALLQLEERYTATHSQLTDSKAENVRLHQLASQIQRNLEHYQQAIEQLRTEQALENEKQQQHYQTQLANLTTKWQVTEVELARTTQNLNQLEQQLSQYDIDNAALKLLSEQRDRENSVLQERLSQLQQALETERSAKQSFQTHIHALEQRNAVLQDQNVRFESALENAHNNLILVEQEKNQLFTEKAIIEAMQKSITTE